MGKKRRILIAALLVVLLGGFAWSLLRPSEPSYQGKSLSTWLENYSRNGADSSGANDAFRHIGTNAIPTLLQMLRATDSGSKARLIELLDRQPLAAIRIASAEDKNYEAYIAFRALGVDAVNAVPELIQIYEEKISMESQCSTADSLAEIGLIAKSAVPSLLRGLTTANAGVRLHTAQALGCIHGEPELVVPELVKLLHDSDRMTPLFAAEALGKFGTNARVAIPILIQKLKDPGTSDPFIRETVTNALKQIDPEAAAKAGVK